MDEGEDRTWVSVEQFEGLLDAAVGRPDVTVTFDDGNLSDLEIGLPRLLERGLKARFYVWRGCWASRAGSMRPGCASCTAPAWSSGRTGGRTATGGRWTGVRAAPREVEEEIMRARRQLGQLTGSDVSEVAVPFGSYDRHVLRNLRRTGVTRVYTSDGGWARSGAWLQARTSIRSGRRPRLAQAGDGRPPGARPSGPGPGSPGSPSACGAEGGPLPHSGYVARRPGPALSGRA